MKSFPLLNLITIANVTVTIFTKPILAWTLTYNSPEGLVVEGGLDEPWCFSANISTGDSVEVDGLEMINYSGITYPQVVYYFSEDACNDASLVDFQGDDGLKTLNNTISSFNVTWEDPGLMDTGDMKG